MEEKILELYEQIKDKPSDLVLNLAHNKLYSTLQENVNLDLRKRHDLISLINSIDCYLQLVSYKNLDGKTFQQFYQENEELCKKSIKPLVQAKEDYQIEFEF